MKEYSRLAGSNSAAQSAAAQRDRQRRVRADLEAQLRLRLQTPHLDSAAATWALLVVDSRASVMDSRGRGFVKLRDHTLDPRARERHASPRRQVHRGPTRPPSWSQGRPRPPPAASLAIYSTRTRPRPARGGLVVPMPGRMGTPGGVYVGVAWRPRAHGRCRRGGMCALCRMSATRAARFCAYCETSSTSSNCWSCRGGRA